MELFLLYVITLTLISFLSILLVETPPSSVPNSRNDQEIIGTTGTPELSIPSNELHLMSSSINVFPPSENLLKKNQQDLIMIVQNELGEGVKNIL